MGPVIKKPGLKTPDAIHLATAILADADADAFVPGDNLSKRKIKRREGPPRASSAPSGAEIYTQ
jgi:predicted nucleic acid-binding protein